MARSCSRAASSPTAIDPEEIGDPNLFGLWDRTFKADGTPAHFFWEVATVDSQLLTGTVTFDPNDPRFDHSQTATFTNIADYASIDRIEARIRIRPLPFAMLAPAGRLG